MGAEPRPPPRTEGGPSIRGPCPSSQSWTGPLELARGGRDMGRKPFTSRKRPQSRLALVNKRTAPAPVVAMITERMKTSTFRPPPPPVSEARLSIPVVTKPSRESFCRPASSVGASREPISQALGACFPILFLKGPPAAAKEGPRCAEMKPKPSP